MKHRNLFICETPFQVLAAILLVFDSLKRDTNDFLISDTMQGYEALSNRLGKCPGVDYCTYVETEISAGKKSKLGRIKDMLIPFDRRWDFDSNRSYDYIYCRNYTSLITESAFLFFKRTNEKLKLVVFDEGYSTYSRRFWRSHYDVSLSHKLLLAMRVENNNYLYNNIEKVMLFEKKLFHVNVPFPICNMLNDNFSLSKEEMEIINNVFEYKDFENLSFDHKFIFFEECFSFDNHNNYDIKIIEELAHIIGKNRIIIKLHPRSKTDRFTTLGYDVMKDINYIWEIFALNNSSSDLTLIAFSSGALLNYLFFSNSKMKSILLYKLFPDKYPHMNDSDTRRWFEEFVMVHNKSVKVPESFESLKNLLSFSGIDS